jgi:DNA-binding NarL/FixJ family response regulator
MKKIRVLLADDHRIVLEGLRGLLEPEFEIVGTVGGFGIVRHCVDIGASALSALGRTKTTRRTNT